MTDDRRRSWAPKLPRFVTLCALLAASLASGTLALGAPSSASSVRGKVAGWEKLVPQVYSDATKNDARRYTWREPSPTVKQDFRKLSANPARDLCIVALGSGTAPGHEPLAVKITGGRATPSTLVLSPGSRLSFKNADPFPHALFEAGNDKWASNPLAPGSTREWAATSPGLHVIRDELFPSVVMYVVVDPAAVEFALPDREGAFSLAVPAGDYTVKAFFDGKQVGKDVTIHAGVGGFEMKEPMTVGGGDSK
jgi:hypothetical protein